LKKNLIYIVGIILIIIGLILKIILNHNIEFWRFAKGTSIFLFAVGITVCLPFEFIKGFQKQEFKSSPLKWVTRNVKQIIILILLFISILGFEKIGENLNYKLREFYLSNNTITTVGSIKGIKQIDFVRLGRQDFYTVNFIVGKELKTYGLITKYAKKDNQHFDNYINPKITNGAMTIKKLKGAEVEVLYSKRFPSFFKIIE
jgi:hypothetical protein